MRLDHITPSSLATCSSSRFRCWACAKSLANANISRLCCDVITINRLKPELPHGKLTLQSTEFPGGYCEWEPPDPIPNSEVKTLSADGSVAVGHVRVGRRQGPNPKPRSVIKLDGALSSRGSPYRPRGLSEGSSSWERKFPPAASRQSGSHHEILRQLVLTNEQSGVYLSALVTVAVKAARRHAL